MKTIKRILTYIFVTLFICSMSIFVSAAPSKPTLKDEPANEQILPYYDVWLHWNDVSNEAHYIMTIRDMGTSGTSDNGLIYNCQYVSQNSTYFIVPKTKLIKGRCYRWCVAAVDSNGNRTYASYRMFKIEDSATDTHLFSGGFSSATQLEYFIYANSTAYDTILNSAATSWNGISSKVHLTRTGSPSDGKYELGIFESPKNSDNSYLLGNTVHKQGGINGTVVSTSSSWDYAEIQTFKANIDLFFNNNLHVSNNFYIQNLNDYYKANAMHEIGHALSLAHTSCKANHYVPRLLCHSYTDVAQMNANSDYVPSTLIPLIMNSGAELSPTIRVVDRDHLRIKWGA